MEELKNKKVAFLAADGFEEVELTQPYEALKKAGAQVEIVSDKDELTSWKDKNWGRTFKTSRKISETDINEFDAVVVPGGVINPDRMRRNKDAVKLLKAFNANGKLVASVCHGPQMLIEADMVQGRKMTSFFSIRKDLENAGAQWEDNEVVQDGNLITSRNPSDLEAFSNKIIDYLRH